MVNQIRIGHIGVSLNGADPFNGPNVDPEFLFCVVSIALCLCALFSLYFLILRFNEFYYFLLYT